MRKAASVALLAIAVASCGTQDENGLGIGIVADLGAQKAVRYVTLAADSFDDFQAATQATNAGESPSITLGTQAGGFVRSLLQFDTAVLPPAGTTVDSAWAMLFSTDKIGTTDSLAVSVHRVTETWGEAAIPDPFPAFLPAADSVVMRVVEIGDTAFVPARTLVQAWIDAAPDSNFGMALVPLDSSGVLLEYGSRNSGRPPKLVVHWTANGADTSVTSTVTFDTSPVSKTPAFVDLSGQPGRLTVGRGIPSGTLIRFPLPELGERATVNRAVLTLHIDHALSDFNDFTLRFQRVTEDPWNADSTLVDTIAYALTSVSSDVDSVRFELGSLVTAIAQEGNHGILVRAHENRPDLDFIRFHGPDTASPALAPSLQLWYTPGEEDAP